MCLVLKKSKRPFAEILKFDQKQKFHDLTLRFNSWPKSDHPTLTFLRQIAQTRCPGGPPSFL